MEKKQRIGWAIIDLMRAKRFPIKRIVEVLEEMNVDSGPLIAAYSDFMLQANIAEAMLEIREKEEDGDAGPTDIC